MFAYVDESGNTGANLFDPQQPTFMTCALITKTDFDHSFAPAVNKLAAKLGTKDLHG